MLDSGAFLLGHVAMVKFNVQDNVVPSKFLFKCIKIFLYKNVFKFRP